MQQRGIDPHGVLTQGIPASYAAGEVVAFGSDVKGFKIGDHVSPSFFSNRFTDDDVAPPNGRDGGVPSVLTEYGVFEDRALVHLPAHLSWEEVRHIILLITLPGTCLMHLANVWIERDSSLYWRHCIQRC